jgi:hypothetical protein
MGHKSMWNMSRIVIWFSFYYSVGVRRVIKTLNPLYANRSWNRTLIRTQSRKRIDSLQVGKVVRHSKPGLVRPMISVECMGFSFL